MTTHRLYLVGWRMVCLAILFLAVSVGHAGGRADTASLSAAARLAGRLLGDGDAVHRWHTGGDATGSRAAGGVTAVHAFSREGGGFAIIASDGTVTELLGFSPDGRLSSSDSLPPPLSEMLYGYGGVAASRSVSDTAPVPVVQLDTPVWGQGEPFNLQCPSHGGLRCMVGCVPVALATVMRYWQWPDAGCGSTADYRTGTHDLRVAPRSLEDGYRWGQMPAQNDGDWSAAQAEAVADLMGDLGAAMLADYGSDATGAGVYPSVLSRFFRYRPEMDWARRDDIASSGGDWGGVLRDELDRGRPVVYAAFGDASGHAFVLDGYAEGGWFRVNWGWDGRYNGYYRLDALYAGSRHYHQDHRALLGFEPDRRDSRAVAEQLVGGASSVRFDAAKGFLVVYCPWTATVTVTLDSRPVEVTAYDDRAVIDAGRYGRGIYTITIDDRGLVKSLDFEIE